VLKNSVILLSEMIKMDELMNVIGYKFKDEELLKTALTHSSYKNTHDDCDEDYERLEFFGDSILSFVVSTVLYNKPTELSEGMSSKIRAAVVCEGSLFECAKKINLGKFVRLGKGEDMSGGRERPSIISDVFEAVIAAIYLDGGLEEARRFILDSLNDKISEMINSHGNCGDYKTALQEVLQQNAGRADYRCVDSSGPDHNRIFTVEVLSDGKVLASGKGRTKKAAKQQAAKFALEMMKK